MFVLPKTVLGLAAWFLAVASLPTPAARSNPSSLRFESSDHDFRGIPHFRFFEAKDFDSSASSVFLATSSDGTLFYGDRNWVFLYDGSSWHKVYQNSNSTRKITAMRWGDDGVVYAGGFNMIGRALLNENNELVLQAFEDPERPMNTGEEFQTIKETHDRVFFQGRRSFACYDKASGRIDSKIFDTWVTASFFFGGAYHIVLDSNEVYRFDEGAFFLLEEISETLKEQDLTFADSVTAPNGDIILGSERRGIYRYDGKAIKPAYPNFQHNRAHLLRDLELTVDNRLILAFLEGGIVVLDEMGNALEAFDARVDHRFKSARSVIIDRSGTLWAMFNSMIAKVLLDSPLTAVDERLRPSFFYASPHMQDGELYVRSFYILYKAEYDERNRLKGFRNALPGQDFEIWSVAPGEEGLYLSTAGNGICLLDDGELAHLVEAPELDRLKEVKADPRYMIGANSREIILYRKLPGGLEAIDKASNPGTFIKRLEEDENGALWLEYGFGAAGRIRVIDDRLQIDYFDHQHGLPRNEWITVWMHEGQAHYTLYDRIVRYNEQTESFEPADPLHALFPDGPKHIERAFTDPAGNIWLSADNLNLILWKNADGSYTRDDRSLREMGEPYFEFLNFFGGGEALITTAFEFFHFKPYRTALTQQSDPAPTRIVRISSLSGAQKFFAYLGDGSAPVSRAFAHRENSLAFTVAHNHSFSTKSPEFQYYLAGFSEGEMPGDSDSWTSSSTAYFTNLDQGRYTFHARARLANGQIAPWAQYSFTVEPPFYATVWAYASYALVSAVAVLLVIRLYSRRLKRQNQKLERMVQERTREIESKNLELEKQAEILEAQNLELANQSEEIQTNAGQLAKALAQLRETQDQLLNTARTAGRAEVATNVLHNVGNVLNSVNVSLANLSTRLSESRVEKLRKLVVLLNQRRDDLQEFLLSDERGRKIPDYLDQLSLVLSEEIAAFLREVEHMGQNVEHIKKIISTQQTHARNVGLHQEFNVTELIDVALAITLGESYATTYRIVKDIDPSLVLRSDKHMVLEILINLIKNAHESVVESGVSERMIRIAAEARDDLVTLEISDNGIGIHPGDAKRLFVHGFTTKNAGHGFGLHSCANAAKSLGGQLSLASDGPGKGAVATLRVPLKASPRLSA